MATSPFARKAKKKGKGVAKKWYFEVQCPSLNVFPIIQRACVSLNIQCTEKSSKMTFPTAVSTASHCPQSAPCLIFPPNQTELDRFLRMAPVVPMEEDVLSGKKQQSVWSDLPEEERKRADWYRSARFARLSGAANLCCKVYSPLLFLLHVLSLRCVSTTHDTHNATTAHNPTPLLPLLLPIPGPLRTAVEPVAGRLSFSVSLLAQNMVAA